MREIDNYFIEKEEPIRSCLVALRHTILHLNPDITEMWKYKMPFYFYKTENGSQKRFCYLWVNNKKEPYIGVVDAKHIIHPDLIAEKRSRMKIILIDPNQDLPVEKIVLILNLAMKNSYE